MLFNQEPYSYDISSTGKERKEKNYKKINERNAIKIQLKDLIGIIPQASNLSLWWFFRDEIVFITHTSTGREIFQFELPFLIRLLT